MVGTWLGEIRSCSCLAVLPDSAWVLLNKIYQPFFTSLYTAALSRGSNADRDEKKDGWVTRRGRSGLQQMKGNFGRSVAQSVAKERPHPLGAAVNRGNNAGKWLACQSKKMVRKVELKWSQAQF